MRGERSHYKNFNFSEMPPLGTEDFVAIDEVVAEHVATLLAGLDQAVVGVGHLEQGRKAGAFSRVGLSTSAPSGCHSIHQVPLQNSHSVPFVREIRVYTTIINPSDVPKPWTDTVKP